ncbi:MAG TPA: ISAzo13 family transposase [Candidatus Angelobacter sp.]|nr:ISAzo13 family transposase [Candidatus Angelobacter sp.]
MREKYRVLCDVLDERGRRVWAAAEANSLPYGGVSLVAQATGLSRTTIHAGMRELQAGRRQPLDAGRSRKTGGGRKPLTFHNPDLLQALEKLVEPTTRGDPESPLRWTCKSTRSLAQELQRQGYDIGERKVADLLHQMGYSLQANAIEGGQHPDRNAQFEYVNAQTKKSLEQGFPVISVDTKKKELVGNYSNHGQEWQPQGEPEKTLIHDFPDKELGKVIPYGIYDLGRNQGWVSVGIDHDTAEFAVDSILAWWRHMGRKTYPQATELLITADAGGSNANRSKLWKVGLQRLANLTGLHIHVSHFPPGTSKWNKIEHRMFSFISKNWRGRPLVSYQTVVDLIANTKTRTGLKIKAKLTRRTYPIGMKVPAAEMLKLNLKPATFHGDWNYSLLPQ